MNVNSVNAQSIQQFLTTSNDMSKGHGKPMGMPPMGMSVDRAEFSEMGQFFSSIRTEIGEEDRAEVKISFQMLRKPLKAVPLMRLPSLKMLLNR